MPECCTSASRKNAKIHSVPDEEDCEDLFLSCDELGEDETMIDDKLNIVTSLYFTYSVFCLLYSLLSSSALLSLFTVNK